MIEKGRLTIADEQVTVEVTAEFEGFDSKVDQSPPHPPSYTATRQALSAAQFGTWVEYYSPNTNMLDGFSWELTLTFDDGSEPFHSSGNNNSPAGFDKIRSLFEPQP